MERIRELLIPFRTHILRTAKAYTATLVVSALGLLAFEVPDSVREAVLALVAALVTWGLTWAIPNRYDTRD